jgi:two-component system chemotaxis sensor kinase CheA
MHLIRNSMDHGIEPSELRLAAGKSEVATVRLSARYSGASVLIEVSDDGATESTRRRCGRARSSGTDDRRCPTQPRAKSTLLIFQPGFSTAQQVTDLSGRGVGMDVVRQRVDSLRGIDRCGQPDGRGHNGDAEAAADAGHHRRAAGERWARRSSCFRWRSTLECIELTREESGAGPTGKHLANVRGELVPYIRLRQYFHVQTSRRRSANRSWW